MKINSNPDAGGNRKEPFVSDHSRLMSFKFAFKGMYLVFKNEKNFRIQCLIGLLTLTVSFFLKLSTQEWIFIIFSIGFVLSAEILNSVTEAIVDFMEPSFNPKAGKIKDMAAAIPLIASITALIVGLFILAPKVWRIFVEYH